MARDTENTHFLYSSVQINWGTQNSEWILLHVFAYNSALRRGNIKISVSTSSSDSDLSNGVRLAKQAAQQKFWFDDFYIFLTEQSDEPKGDSTS